MSVSVTVALCRTPPLVLPLRRLLAEAVRELEAGEATLWVFADDKGVEPRKLAAALNHGPTSATVEAQAVPLDDSVVGWVATQGTAMSIGPGDWQNASVIDATGTPVEGMVAAPVRAGVEVIGTLSVVNPRGRPRFSADDLREAERCATKAGALVAAAVRKKS